MKLVLIESSGKQESIQKYLGKEYKVVATKGHVRDLPVKTQLKLISFQISFYLVFEGLNFRIIIPLQFSYYSTNFHFCQQ